MIERKRDKSLLEETREIVYGKRNQDYGHPINNHTRTADAWNWWINGKYDLDIDLTPEDVCMMMVLVKLSRAMHGENEDDLRDIMGYAENVDIIREYVDNQLKSNSNTMNIQEEPLSVPLENITGTLYDELYNLGYMNKQDYLKFVKNIVSHETEK